MTIASPRRTRLELVTIVVEAVLEERLLRDVSRLGATGWTVSHVRGRGSRGTRTSQLEGGNARIEVVVSEAVAERILDHLAEHYFAHFALVAWSHPVQVVRGEKYV